MRIAGAIDRARTLSPRSRDALLALALAVTLELQLVLADEPGVSVVGVLGGLGLTLPLAWRRRAPLAVAILFAAVTLLQGVLGGDLYAGAPPLLAALVAGGVAFYSLAAHTPERTAVAGLAIGVAGLWSTVIVSDHRDAQSFVFSAGIVGLSPWLAGRATRARALRVAALEREREQRDRVAASEERQRIARELHDVVAHGVVLMVLQAQGAQRIMDRDPDRARDALIAIEESGKTALSEIRGSLGMLRDGDLPAERKPQPTLDDLQELVDEMRRTGLGVELRVEGAQRPLADGVDRSAYRIVQEALTNTVKHAGLVPTRVTVSYAPDNLTLEIADSGNGEHRTSGRGRNGQGIVGMRERVRLYGGELEVHERDDGGGFVVRARIPLAT
jgi:signal transduction histidine kinase